jgi:hypothetical protein
MNSSSSSITASIASSIASPLVISSRVVRDGGRTNLEKFATVNGVAVRAGVGGQWLQTVTVTAQPLIIRGKAIPRSGTVTIRRGAVVTPRQSLYPRIEDAIARAATGAHAWVDADSEACG